MSELIEPKSITLTTQDGKERTYTISKFPAIIGREIVASYPLANMISLAKDSEYKRSEEAMLKLMSFVSAFSENGTEFRLSTPALVDNHVPDWHMLMQLEWAMLEYNVGFLQKGLKSEFLVEFSRKASSSIAPMLTDLLLPLFGAVKQACETSGASTLSKMRSTSGK